MVRLCWGADHGGVGKQTRPPVRQVALFGNACSFVHPLILGIYAFFNFLEFGIFADAPNACCNFAGDFLAARFAVSSVTDFFSAGSTGIFDVYIDFLKTTGLEHGNDQRFFDVEGRANLVHAGTRVVAHIGSNFVHLFLVLLYAFGAIFSRSRIQEELAAIRAIFCSWRHHNRPPFDAVLIFIIPFFNEITRRFPYGIIMIVIGVHAV